MKQTRHSIPASTRQSLRERCQSRCEFDGQGADHWDAHHRKQRSLGGTDTLDNLVALCRQHHDEVHTANDYTGGWLVHSWSEPVEVPITMWDGVYLLAADGGMTRQP